MPKVLVVEDEENYRTFLKKVVERRFECETASNGNEAKAKILKDKFDIIIHDLRLPGIQGKELIKYVRRFVDNDIINIIITGYENDWPTIESKEEDVFYYLKKGEFKPDDLIKILENAIKVRNNRLNEKNNLYELIKREKKSFLTKLAISIAHEINNPLQSMILVTHLLKRNFLRMNNSPVSMDIDEELNILEKSIQRIKKTIELLIEFNTKNPSEEKYQYIKEILKLSVSFLRPITKERGIKLNDIVYLNDVSSILISDSYIFALLYFFLEYVDFPIKDINLIVKRDKSQIILIIKSLIKTIWSDNIKEKEKLYLSKDIFKILGGSVTIHRGKTKIITMIKINSKLTE